MNTEISYEEMEDLFSKFKDQHYTFFKKLAKARNRGESLEEVIENYIKVSKKYKESERIKVSFINDIPTNLLEYEKKLRDFSCAFEECWYFLPEEDRLFLISLSLQYIDLALRKFNGFDGLCLRLKLLIPSILKRDNLFERYLKVLTIIPQAVDRTEKIDKDLIEILSNEYKVIKKKGDIFSKIFSETKHF